LSARTAPLWVAADERYLQVDRAQSSTGAWIIEPLRGRVLARE
jgi:hypothetical protein